ncbi:AbrB/MazE/SpoVT family DNA-binding domain-containing protein [Candidatus Omnitrophota bacterium]
MHKFHKLFKTVTVGERGQVVIPKEARQFLDIKAGDKLVVASGDGGKKIIKLVPAEEFAQLLSQFEKHLSTAKTKNAKKG